VQGVVAAVDWTARAGPAFEIVNLGGSRTTRLDRLVALLGAALGVRPAVERRAEQPGDVRRTWADIRKARQLLDYDPSTTVEEGIPRFVSWFEEARGA
jgi:UDP-glucuronate 4-epimerase